MGLIQSIIYVQGDVERYLVEGEVFAEEEEQTTIVGSYCEYLYTVDQLQIEKEQFYFGVVRVVAVAESVGQVRVKGELVFVFVPNFEFSMSAGGEDGVIITVCDASDFSQVAVGQVVKLFVFEVVVADICAGCFWVVTGEVDILVAMIVEGVFVTGNGQHVLVDLVEGVGLGIVEMETDCAALTQNLVNAISAVQFSQFYRRTVNGSLEVDAFQFFLLSYDKIVFFVAGLNTCIRTIDTVMVISAELFEQVFMLFLSCFVLFSLVLLVIQSVFLRIMLISLLLVVEFVAEIATVLGFGVVEGALAQHQFPAVDTIAADGLHRQGSIKMYSIIVSIGVQSKLFTEIDNSKQQHNILIVTLAYHINNQRIQTDSILMRIIND